ncbi:hypothetical protein J5N97_014071 [Dioscorea zingiberensis]|uniref:Uncharacterized protein n=1 Tax=Dioscorea zingiberensis TaxID=325984 RepID=A0A9D5CU59_9LILI|nr:hypothetical protein J5N97_014071 [Dioscorea zingiberensis]
MGNCITCSAEAPGGKIILPDGTARSLGSMVSVAELMLEHPSHFVFDLQALSGHATTAAPLPADHELDPHKIYVVLPSSGATVEKARRRVSGGASVLRSWSFPVISCGFRSGEGEEETGYNVKARCSTEVQSEREGLLRSRAGWKPSLGTIEERVLEKKVFHCLF